jgi:hypothetical protein
MVRAMCVERLRAQARARTALIPLWLIPLSLVALLASRDSRAEAPPSTEPVSGAARALDPAADALAFDVWRIVDSREDSGWLIDEEALEAIEIDLMESVCRAAPEARAAALLHLARQREAFGDPRLLFQQDGSLTPRVDAALSAQRRHQALERGSRAAADCPFWLTPQRGFRGLQSTRERFIVNFDTGGTVQLRRTDEWTVGAGGFGRLLGGYSFTHVSLLAGIEFGGGALLEPGTEPTEFVINYIPALPLIVRMHREAWHLDVEAAPVALFQQSDTTLSFGVRAGVTIGISALRLRGVLPWVGLGMATEYHFENTARPAAQYLRGGFRVGGVWDP